MFYITGAQLKAVKRTHQPKIFSAGCILMLLFWINVLKVIIFLFFAQNNSENFSFVKAHFPVSGYFNPLRSR